VRCLSINIYKKKVKNEVTRTPIKDFGDPYTNQLYYTLIIIAKYKEIKKSLLHIYYNSESFFNTDPFRRQAKMDSQVKKNLSLLRLLLFFYPSPAHKRAYGEGLLDINKKGRAKGRARSLVKKEKSQEWGDSNTYQRFWRSLY
jgi:hypothetical protein